MDWNTILPSAFGVIAAVLTVILADRIRAKADYSRAETEAERAETEREESRARINTTIAEATDKVRTQLVEEIDRIQTDLNATRATITAQNGVIASLRLEISEAERRYKRQIEELEATLKKCQIENDNQRKKFERIISRYEIKVDGLEKKVKNLGGVL